MFILRSSKFLFELHLQQKLWHFEFCPDFCGSTALSDDVVKFTQQIAKIYLREHVSRAQARTGAKLSLCLEYGGIHG